MSLTLFAASMAVGAPDAMIYPSRPGPGTRDSGAPGYRVEGDRIYPTRPGSTIRAFDQPDHPWPGGFRQPKGLKLKPSKGRTPWKAS